MSTEIKLRRAIKKILFESIQDNNSEILSVGDVVVYEPDNSTYPKLAKVENIELVDQEGKETGKTVQNIYWNSTFIVDLDNGKWARNFQIKPTTINTKG